MGMLDEFKKANEQKAAKVAADKQAAKDSSQRAADEVRAQTARALKEFLSDSYLTPLIVEAIQNVPGHVTNAHFVVVGSMIEQFKTDPQQPGGLLKTMRRPFAHNLPFPGIPAAGLLSEGELKARVDELDEQGIRVTERLSKGGGSLILSVSFPSLKE